MRLDPHIIRPRCTVVSSPGAEPCPLFRNRHRDAATAKKERLVDEKIRPSRLRRVRTAVVSPAAEVPIQPSFDGTTDFRIAL